MANRQLYNPGGIFIFTWDRIWGNWRVGRFFSFSERWVWRMIRFGKEEKLNLYVKKIEEDCMMENGLMDISFFWLFPFFNKNVKRFEEFNYLLYYIFFDLHTFEIVLFWDNWKFEDEEEMKRPFFSFFFKELIGTQTSDISDRGINLNFIIQMKQMK